ncbi:MerR family transcriptional regulator [Actinoplanes sichuanensis]|uniref:MerR family transcriptional regulator n=1 Tax=Actinoplanes sichuanensis TaxID=512349 RepID=A0ABW4AI98_9ACTN|nr:MerR family transcriptional regulator [Actinoplanes sichuanensis]BEL03991.1 MerR family transcriptional regulator [Actinoplanes sichuanensis]
MNDGEPDETPTLRTIGQLAQRVGLPVRTVRFWSDIGILPPTGRTNGNYRLYDDAAVLRCELVLTLRELGLGLEAIQQIMAEQTTLARVAAVHVAALDAEIRTLRLRRAVLSTVARRGSTLEEAVHMRKLAHLSVTERQRTLRDFVDRTFDGLALDADAETVREWMREIPDLLPDDPTADQVDAWIELADLVTDPAFTHRLRRMLTAESEDLLGYDLRPAVLELAGHALAEDITPDSPRGREIVDRIVETTRPSMREALADQLELLADPSLERFWTLTAVLQGRDPGPTAIPAFRWLISGLRSAIAVP